MSALITVILIGWMLFGSDFWLWPVRLPTYLNAKKKYNPHVFDAHIRRDIGTITNFCDVCNRYRGNWIHLDEYSVERVEGYKVNKILELETADIKWRFANDPEWVKVFGEEYDPKTFLPIPKYHNGECGGPHDSCERCAWEADQKKTIETIDQREVDKVVQAEVREYEKVLWTLWNTVHEPDIAHEEFEDLSNELGMMKNHAVRNKIKDLDVYKRLKFCLTSRDVRWCRREEVWFNEKARYKRRETVRYDSF